MLDFFLISFCVVMLILGFAACVGIVEGIRNGGADFVKVRDLGYLVAEKGSK